MNCAVVDLIGSGRSKKRADASQAAAQSALGSLPDLYVANLKGVNDCVTKETADPAFDDPGADVAYGDGMKAASGASGGKNACTGVGRKSTGSTSQSLSSGSSSMGGSSGGSTGGTTGGSSGGSSGSNGGASSGGSGGSSSSGSGGSSSGGSGGGSSGSNGRGGTSGGGSGDDGQWHGGTSGGGSGDDGQWHGGSNSQSSKPSSDGDNSQKPMNCFDRQYHPACWDKSGANSAKAVSSSGNSRLASPSTGSSAQPGEFYHLLDGDIDSSSESMGSSTSFYESEPSAVNSIAASQGSFEDDSSSAPNTDSATADADTDDDSNIGIVTDEGPAADVASTIGAMDDSSREELTDLSTASDTDTPNEDIASSAGNAGSELSSEFPGNSLNVGRLQERPPLPSSNGSKLSPGLGKGHPGVGKISSYGIPPASTKGYPGVGKFSSSFRLPLKTGISYGVPPVSTKRYPYPGKGKFSSSSKLPPKTSYSYGFPPIPTKGYPSGGKISSSFGPPFSYSSHKRKSPSF